jgi:UDP-N-acetyl-2-amino-2-deoxyglucuronate dehydrogenase
MNYCLIGLGFISQRHRDAIHDTGGQVILTCDIDESKNPDFTNYLEMFESKKFKEEIDTVIIATPNHLHKQMIKDALATGKRVLCEKPLILDNNFEGLEGVSVVLQLRHHDFISEIKRVLKSDKNEVEIIMKVYRDSAWWDSWRGSAKKSGGILIGLAIHQFDLLIFLLGNEYSIIESNKSRKKCTGTIKFPTATIKYHIEVLDSRERQTRDIIVNGKKFMLCNKDSLSFAGYHHKIYEDFIKGNGIPLSEARKSIELVLKL